MNISKELLTGKETSEYIGVKESTLAVWRCDKRYSIPFIKVGHLVRYRKSDLDKWLDEQTQNSNGGCNG